MNPEEHTHPQPKVCRWSLESERIDGGPGELGAGENPAPASPHAAKEDTWDTSSLLAGPEPSETHVWGLKPAFGGGGVPWAAASSLLGLYPGRGAQHLSLGVPPHCSHRSPRHPEAGTFSPKSVPGVENYTAKAARFTPRDFVAKAAGLQRDLSADPVHPSCLSGLSLRSSTCASHRYLKIEIITTSSRFPAWLEK